MLFRMIRGVLVRQWSKMLLIAFTIALGASLATSMINVMLDVTDKVTQELKTYGANIVVKPRDASLLEDLYDVEDGGAEITEAWLNEADVGKIKTIFWTYNIVDFAPFLETEATMPSGSTVPLKGTWFNHHFDTPTGESVDAGVASLRAWWDITDGAWIDEQKEDSAEQVMIGSVLAERERLKAGDSLRLQAGGTERNVTVAGVFDAGGEEDEHIYAPLSLVQEMTGREGKVASIEVSAITTPDNDLARRAAQNPKALSQRDYDTWYCTAYVSAICYQITEVIPGSVASAVRQVAESEGAILDKTQLLMILITILSLIGSALGISNLVTASVMERSQEIGLLKAIGANDRAITGTFMTEILITALFGGTVGYFMGFGFAQLIGQSVFGSAIEMKPLVIPIVAVLIALVTIAGSLPAIRMVLHLDPAEVLHGSKA